MTRRGNSRRRNIEVILLGGLLSLSLLLESATGLSSVSVTRQQRTTVEDQLVQTAVTLPAVTSYQEATEQLISNGVCRINRVVSEEQCSLLKEYLLESLNKENEAMNLQTVPPSIPNTRLNCGSEPLLVPLNHRTDVLVPLENPLIRDTLQHLVQELGPIYEKGVQELLPKNDNVSTGTTAAENSPIQLLEAASLISQKGATHQPLHADFRRNAVNKNDRLPPRLVTFLYLQDTPTKDHGPTIFLPRTNTPQAHQQWDDCKDQARNNHDNDHYIPILSDNSNNQPPAMAATLSQGDVAIYDASVLHFGSANNVPGNTRAVFYFGVGHSPSEKESSYQCDDNLLLPPVLLEKTDPNVGFWSHETLSGYGYASSLRNKIFLDSYRQRSYSYQRQ